MDIQYFLSSKPEAGHQPKKVQLKRSPAHCYNGLPPVGSSINVNILTVVGVIFKAPVLFSCYNSESNYCCWEGVNAGGVTALPPIVAANVVPVVATDGVAILTVLPRVEHVEVLVIGMMDDDID